MFPAVADLPVPAGEDLREARFAQGALLDQFTRDLVPGQAGDDDLQQRFEALVEGLGGGSLEVAGESDAGQRQRQHQDQQAGQHQPGGQGEAPGLHDAGVSPTRR